MSRVIVVATGAKGPKGDTGPVESVNGQDGVVVLDAADVGAEAIGVAAGLVDDLEGVVDALDFNDVGADQAGTSAAQIVIHSADTTNVHGIPDTALLLNTATKLDDLAATDDNTDLNATTSKHGLLRKLSGTSTEYLSGTGAWSVPAGGGGSGDGDLLAANNLSDLASAATARTNLGLGTAATTAASAYEVAGATAAHTIASDPHGDRAYADAQIAAASATAFDFKASARVATTANITLSGAQTIDGVSVIATDRVLVKDQSTASQNGIYVAAAGAWSRATDADISAEVVAGMAVPVDEGTVGAGILFILTTPNPITLATTALTFTPLSSGGDMLASNNLSELTSPSTARTNLGLTIGTNVQAFSAVLAATTASFLTADETKLDAIEAGATADMTAAEILTAIKTVDGAGSGLDADLLDGISSAGFDVAGAAAAAQAAAIAASQPLDSDLTALAALTTTSYGRALLALADAAALRIAAGLGTMSTQAATAVAITGGTVTGITDLAVADGGTGSSTQAGARTNLGLGTAAVAATGDFDPAGSAANAQAASQPVDADLTAIAALTTTSYGRAFLALVNAAGLTTLIDAAGATLDADTTTAGKSFVIDEDSFASDLATKVPTQQSVKAWVTNEFIQSDDIRTIVVLTQAEYDAIGSPSATTQYNITDATTDVPAASTTVEGIVELATNAETITGTDAARAVTPAGLQAKVASTAASGIVELATNAETATGTDTARAVTPAGLQAKVATATAAGIVELATNGEVATGTDDTRAVTPGGLASLAATTVVRGIIEIATPGESVTGTDGTRAVAPDGLAAALAAFLTATLASTGQTQTGTSTILAVTPAGAAATYAVLSTRVTFANTNYPITATKTVFVAQTGTMAASRTVTLPAASAFRAGDVLTVYDESGTVTATNTIVITRAGSDTIAGATTVTIAAAYGWRRLVSDGVSKWSYDGGVLRSASNLSDLVDAAAARTNLGLGTAALISSTAGGDLSGTLPSPTVAKINGVAVTGTPSVGYVPTATSASAATWQAQSGGGSGANLTYTPAPTNGVVASDTGTDATLTLAGGTNAGLMAPADFTKLAGVEALADVTDAANVNTAGAVMESDYDANTILAATTDNTPTPLTVGASTIVARLAAGNIVAATPAQLKTLLAIASGDVSGLGTAATTAATDYATAAQGTTADGAVPKSLYDANTVLYATTDNTPAALTVGASTIVGRKATGNIVALTGTETGALIKLDELAAPTDITTLNATTSLHGLLPKLGGGTTNFLRADGTWNPPAGGGAVATDVIFDAKGDLAVGTGADTAAKLAVGTDGQVLGADSTASTGQAWRSIAFTRKTGAAEYYLPDVTNNGTAVAVAQSKLFFLPLTVHQTYTIDRVAISCTALAASSSGRFGLYASTNGRPGGVLQDTGASAVDTTTTGDKTATVSWAMTPGLYWLAVVFQGGAPTVRACTYSTEAASLVGTTTLSDLTAATPNQNWVETGVTGALPSTATPVAQGSGSSTLPRIIIRIT